MFKKDEKQQKQLEEFFYKEEKLNSNFSMVKVVGYLIATIGLFINVMPVIMMSGTDDNRNSVAMLIIMGLYMHLMGIRFLSVLYSTFKEDRSKITLKAVTLFKYLPVDTDQVVIFRIRKIFKPCLVYTLIALFFRVLISVLAYHSIAAADIAIPVLGMLVLPVLYEMIFRSGSMINDVGYKVK